LPNEGTAGEDKRPRPQFGELAPEGWKWTPPVPKAPAGPEADAERTSAASVTPSKLDAKKPDPKRPDAKKRDAAAIKPVGARFDLDAPQKPLRLGDVLVTSVLIMLGLVLTASGVQQFFALQDMIGLFYTQEGIGRYSGGTTAQTAGAVAAVAQIIIMLAVIGFSVQLIGKRRLSFWVPLAGGALAVVVVFICMMAALLADPTFMTYVQGMSRAQ
jgi:hypothetical protein